MKKGYLVALTLLAVAVAGFARNKDFAWNAPTENIDGSPLEDLAGFRIYFRPDTNFVLGADVIGAVMDNVNPAPVQGEEYGIEVDIPGNGWITGTAVDLYGNESEFADPLYVDTVAPRKIILKFVDIIEIIQ